MYFNLYNATNVLELLQNKTVERKLMIDEIDKFLLKSR